ncbi:MAG: hypothetical protein ABSF67_10315 [Roseiarcus sp.]|jgi:hypothetical protein
MSSIIAPLHTAPLGVATLRFFRPPSAMPDVPWHAYDDLLRCIDLPRAAHRQFHQMLTSGPFKGDVRTVATSDGIVTIAPHFIAQGLIGAAIEAWGARPELEMEYTKALVAAMKQLTGDLPPFASFEFVLAAARNASGAAS